MPARLDGPPFSCSNHSEYMSRHTVGLWSWGLLIGRSRELQWQQAGTQLLLGLYFSFALSLPPSQMQRQRTAFISPVLQLHTLFCPISHNPPLPLWLSSSYPLPHYSCLSLPLPPSFSLSTTPPLSFSFLCHIHTWPKTSPEWQAARGTLCLKPQLSVPSMRTAVDVCPPKQSNWAWKCYIGSVCVQSSRKAIQHFYDQQVSKAIYMNIWNIKKRNIKGT